MSEATPLASNLLRLRDQEVVIDMNNWRRAEKGATLATYALLPCIGVAIYDGRNRVGHMAHWPAPEERPEMVEAMLQSALQTDTPPHQLRAWLRGAAADLKDREYIASIAAARSFMADQITEAGIISCVTRWSEQPLYVDMRLHCANGAFISTARPASFE